MSESFDTHENGVQRRLEYLRGELRAERISWGELAELQDLAPHITPGDIELLEAAGVPEFDEGAEGEHAARELGEDVDQFEDV